MLPFTKRPGRDESGDEDVVTKDDLITAETKAPASLRDGAGRGKFASINDEEMTTLMPTKTIGDALATAVAARAATPRPAAGAPPASRSTPSSRPGTIPPAPASRSGKFAAQEDEEEDGRTVVRGAPKIVKRSNATSPPNSSRAANSGKMGGPTLPTTISPAAVIKATLESARAGVKPRTDRLMAGPPQDLLEDLADLTGGDRHPADVGAEHTAILKAPHSNPPPGMIQGVKALSTQMMQPQPLPHGTIPPGSSRPMSNPPPGATQSGGYAAQSGGYPAQYNGPVPSGSVSVPGVAMPQSMPAHFMVPHGPYSDGRIDPPGTAVTSRMKVGGRPAMSWALALAAFGIFVGVGAVAVMNGNDGLKDTSASFVDPSRASGGPGTRTAAAVAQPATPGAPTGVPVANDQPSTGDRVGVPPVAVPASPAAGDTVAAPVVTAPAAPPAVVAAPAAPAVIAAAPAAPAPRPAAVAAAAPAPRPAAAAPAPRATSKPAPQAADDAPVAAAPTTKGGKGGKGGGKGGEMDDETKKALDELQKAQLERSF
jgi:hypothetical protein